MNERVDLAEMRAVAIDSIFDPARRRTIAVPIGSTIQEMVDFAFPVSGAPLRVTIGDMVVEQRLWRRVRPKPGTVVVVRPIAQGNLLRSALQIALVVAAVALGQYYAVPLATALSVPTAVASALITTATLVVGQILLDALIPLKGPTQDPAKYTVNGLRNQANPDGAVPLVLGKIRSAPPYAALPYTQNVNDDQYVTAAFCFGYGPLLIENERIGETPITKYVDVVRETRQGYANDAPLTLYPQQVIEQQLSTELSQFYGEVTRFTASDATEAQIDIQFPSGLCSFGSDGKKGALDVTIAVRYRPVTDTADDADWITLPNMDFVAADTSPILRTVIFELPTRGRWEFGLTRLTEDYDDEDSSQKTSRSFWSVLRSIRPEYILNFEHPLALAAVHIRATKQLQGTLDQYNADITSLCPDWDGAAQAWVVRATNNPASLFRYVLTGPAIAYPFDLSEIDDAGLIDWHGFCVSKGLQFNCIFDQTGVSIYDVLTAIAAAGRATPQDRGTSWGVVIDRALDFVSAHISPRNSWGFQGQRPFAVFPDAFRVTFLDETNEFAQGERIVPFPGLVGDPQTFEAITLQGITNPDLVWKETRRRQYELMYRPDTFTTNQDWEALQVARGDRVQLSHDVLDRTMVAARVAAVSGTLVQLDDLVTFEPGQTFACRFRLGDGTSALWPVTGFGETRALTLVAPLSGPTPPMPDVGDLAMFGPSSEETLACTVKSVEAMSDFTARLTLVEHAPQIEALVDAEVPPAWTGRAGEVLTSWQQTPVTPVITKVLSGYQALAIAGSSILYPVAVEIAPGPGNTVPLKAYNVQYRKVGTTPWSTASGTSGSGAVVFGGYAKGDQLEIQAQAVSINNIPSAWSATTTVTLGAGDPPAPDPVTSAIATAQAHAVKLTWVSSDSSNSAATEILRSTTNDINTSAQVVAINSGPNAPLAYTDTGLTTGTAYYFWLVSLDNNTPPMPGSPVALTATPT